MKASTETIVLDHPLEISGAKIEQVTLRKPSAGELRGLSLQALAQCDVNALHVLIPRISNPSISQAAVAALDPADLMQMGGVIVGFLLPDGLAQVA